MSRKKAKTVYRVRNWSQCNQALIQRGGITLWLSEDVIASWLNAEKTGKRVGVIHMQMWWWSWMKVERGRRLPRRP